MDIKIGKSAHTCALCEADFVHEAALQSRVHVVEGQFAREDYCTECWTPELADEAYSTWTAHYYDPKVAEQEPEEAFSPLRQTFYASVEKETRPDLAVAYLAAQLLRRQKVFRLIKETKDPETDISQILFNDRIGNRLIEVSDPSLSHAELETARQILMNTLAALEAPDEPEESAEQYSPDDTSDEQASLSNEPSTDAEQEHEGESHATEEEIAQAQ